MPKRDTRPVPVDRVRELLDYDPVTGIFRWRERRSFTALAGSVAGHRKKGKKPYITIYIDNVGYKAHRLAWAWMTGVSPVAQIDHRNIKHDDNRWANLREATNSQNVMNSRLRSDNKSGVKGVRFCSIKNRWVAGGALAGRSKTIGTFRTKKEAVVARRKFSKEQYGQFARAK